jgi:uncharacterized damage-inducible protein DinB
MTPNAVILDVQREQAPRVGEERSMLEGWLDFHRQTLLGKCSGLDGEALARAACPPSGLSLLALVRHMTEVERHWLRRPWNTELDWVYCTDEDGDADFDRVDPARASADVAAYRAEVTVCREAIAVHDLDEETAFPNPNTGERRLFSVRWIYLHMIEEYARHNGHADLLRERLDGATGA